MPEEELAAELALCAMRPVLAARQERLRLMDLRHKQGIAGCLQVLDSQRQRVDVELQLTQQTGGTHTCVIELHRARGGGWQPE